MALLNQTPNTPQGRKKPHTLVVTGMKGRTLWLALATGTLSYQRHQTVIRGDNARVQLFGFDTMEELDAAAERVRACPEFGSRMTLSHHSFINGNAEMRDLKGAE